MDDWYSNYSPSDDIDNLEEDIANAIHSAATSSIAPILYKSKDKWFHTDRVGELKHSLLQIC